MIAFGESESNRKCHIVCQRINDFGYPEIDFIDEEKINHYSWIHGKKQAKQGKGELAWYKSDEKIANSYGLFNLFDLIDNKQINLNNTQYCIDYYEINGKYPTRYSGTTEDKKNGEWLARLKSRRSPYFLDCLKYATHKGHKNMFEWGNKTEEAINKILDLFEWVKENGIPQKKSSGIEKTYYNLIRNLVRAKNGTSDNVWYPEFDSLFDKNNMWHLITSVNDKRIEICQLFIKFVVENKRAPNSKETKLYNYWQKVIRKNKCSHEEIDLINNSGVMIYCKSQDDLRIEIWSKHLRTLSQYFEKSNKLPPAKLYPSEINTLSEIKRRYNKNTLDIELIHLAIELNFIDQLKFIDKKQVAKEKFLKLCDRLQKGTKPSLNSGLPGDSELASYISTLLKGLRGKRGFVKYDFYSEIAKEKNVHHFFEGLL